MIKKHLSRKNLAKFKVNSVVKAFILAEMFLWSGLNFVMLFFSVYVATLPGGSIQRAASATSLYFLSRVFFVLMSGRLLTGKSKEVKFTVTVLGMTMLSLCYLLISLTSYIPHIYFLFASIGGLIGMVTPAKNTLFSSHINKEKESLTWSVLDAGIFLCMAITTSIGGVLVGTYGFKALFYLASIINLFAIVPYLIYLQEWKQYVKLQKVSARVALVRGKYFK